ncbi:hypothetical protein GRS66_004213, partial [Saccharomyces pastorianus]
MAWEALAVERMLRNDEEYKEYLEDIEPYHGDPVGYLKYFSVKERSTQIQRNYAWYLAITRRRETISLALGVTPSKVPHWTAFLSMLIGLFCNKTFRQKLEYLLEQISEVWLLPHWVDLANVEVLAADNTRVPLYMLMVAVHKELDSDDVPDGRFDIILLCRDSSRSWRVKEIVVTKVSDY